MEDGVRDIVNEAYLKRREHLSKTLPEDVASRQAADELRRSAARAIQSGAFVSEICQHLGLPASSIVKALQITGQQKTPPAVAYLLEEEDWDVDMLRRQLTLEDRITQHKQLEKMKQAAEVKAAALATLRGSSKLVKGLAAMAARHSGVPNRHIAVAMGISTSRVSQLCSFAARHDEMIQTLARVIAEHAADAKN